MVPLTWAPKSESLTHREPPGHTSDPVKEGMLDPYQGPDRNSLRTVATGTSGTDFKARQGSVKLKDQITDLPSVVPWSDLLYLVWDSLG